MKLTKLEQSGFILETSSGYRLAIDVGSYTPLERLEGVSVDAMLISHIHADHFSLDQIKKLAPKKLYLNQECFELARNEVLSSEIVQVKVGDTVGVDGIKVTYFDVDHGPNVKIRPKENFGFLIEADAHTIYFAGDMFYPSGMDVTGLEVDIALIPVGGFYTFGPKEALEFVKRFKKVGKVTPMHYQKDPATLDEFVGLAVAAGLVTDSFVL